MNKKAVGNRLQNRTDAGKGSWKQIAEQSRWTEKQLETDGRTEKMDGKAVRNKRLNRAEGQLKTGGRIEQMD